MISMYVWQQIQTMRSHGMKVKKISKTLGLSVNTVRKYLRIEGPPVFKGRVFQKKVDPYVDQIQEMLQKRYIGTRIYRELQALGYPGGVACVRRYIRGVKLDQEKSGRCTTRVETGPGQQMQYDWKEWILSVVGQRVKIYLHQVILSYSRLKHYTFSLSITGQDVIRAIVSALSAFGGAAQELWIDNPKQMVLVHRHDGVIGYNEAFLKICGFYGIEPNACHPYRAQTKGKVERPFYVVQEHLLRGLEVSDLQEFERRLSAFNHEENQWVNRELGQAPLERFEKERLALRPLPSIEPTSLFLREIRQVSSDGYISYRGSLYPVPMAQCLSQVWVECVFGRELAVYSKEGKLVAKCPVGLSKSRTRPEHPEHRMMNAAYEQKRQGRKAAVVDKFTAMFSTVGEAYVEGLRQNVTSNLHWHLHSIMDYGNLAGLEAVQEAMKQCLEIGAYHKGSVWRLLEASGMKPAVPKPSPCLRDLPRGNLTRALSEYAGLGEVSHA